jgi:hypothetical protein
MLFPSLQKKKIIWGGAAYGKGFDGRAKKNAFSLKRMDASIISTWGLLKYEGDAWKIFTQSQGLLLKLITRKQNSCTDELLFIDFRPRWLCIQQRVYTALKCEACSICLIDTFPESQVVQHNRNHPAICRRCFEKLTRCPFCRITLRYTIKPINLWPVLNHII